VLVGMRVRPNARKCQGRQCCEGRIALTDEQWASLQPTIPMGRVGEPPEVANVIVSLLSDEWSYVTGPVHQRQRRPVHALEEEVMGFVFAPSESRGSHGPRQHVLATGYPSLRDHQRIAQRRPAAGSS
jgi:hypothetical protein